jgi:antitoxin (DNA-binding transcriptional repressor) of toxin-antitoxin stability system
MIQVNIGDAKTHLSRYLDAVEKGEVVILCRHNKPIAELRRVEREPPKEARRFGLWDGFGVSESFFEPLPEELMKAFYGESE